MNIITDLQIHSKFARAVSKEMTIPGIAVWARKKGIDLMATGDWTHPLWMKEIQTNLHELGNGFLSLTEKACETAGLPYNQSPRFLLATEVSCIYSQNGKGRRVHTLIWVSSLKSALAINRAMTKRGCNLLSDGRPIIGLTSIEVAELVFTIDDQALIIPAHAWTPWFSVFGSMSGFNSISEAFGPYAERIYAIETGLSSNPAMNWQIPELDNRAILSFSDAHSGPKLGREATVLAFDGVIDTFSYQHLYSAITAHSKENGNPTLKKFIPPKEACSIDFTLEFFPEEGKYHYSGHRACGIRWGPEETLLQGTTCPVCGKNLTQGVVQRISELSGRTEVDLELVHVKKRLVDSEVDLSMTASELFPERPPYLMLVPLKEVIAECLGCPITSKKIAPVYDLLITHFGSEFAVFLKSSVTDIETVVGTKIAEAIEKVRQADIYIDPGYDGVFGVIKIWKDETTQSLIDTSKKQLPLL